MKETTVVVAMDIHKKFSKCVGLDCDGHVTEEWIVGHDSKQEMRAFFNGLIPGTDVVMEATFNWPWIADLALEAGVCPHLAHPERAREMAKQYSKTDRKDCIWLGRLYQSKQVFPKAYLAPKEVRDMRGLCRQRLTLVGMRTAAKNSVHGQLFRLGIPGWREASDLFGRKGRKYLAGLELEGRERWLLDQKLKVIDQLREEMKVLEEQILLEVQADPRASILMSIPGVGVITAHTILAEIGQIERFADRRALASYAGVLPLDKESAGKERPEHTTKKCNQHLKHALIEAVTGVVKGSGRFRSLYLRVRRRNKDRAGKARVAVARELAELV